MINIFDRKTLLVSFLLFVSFHSYHSFFLKSHEIHVQVYGVTYEI